MRPHVILSKLLHVRLGRTALSKKDAVYFAWRYITNLRRTWVAYSSKKKYPDAAEVAAKMGTDGIVVGPSDHYLSPEGRDALSNVSDLILALSRESVAEANAARAQGPRRHDSKNYLIHLVPPDYTHSADSPLIKLATDEKLLEIVASYLGLAPSLHGVGAWLNFPTGEEAKSSQLWHRDPEDIKNVKVFIYLADVDLGRGPFCYVPGTQPLGALTVKGLGKRQITDEEMGAVIDPSKWMACVGPANTMILADTVGYHRGGRATNGNRILITLTYTSGSPLNSTPFNMKDRPSWAMSDLQRTALSRVQQSVAAH